MDIFKRETRKMNRTDDKKNNREKKELDFYCCPKHGTRYPKGSECPKCEEEKRKKK